jgi:hypothetical protein
MAMEDLSVQCGIMSHTYSMGGPIKPEEHALETYKSLQTISLEAAKGLVLLNGGAIVVMLAFLGQIPAKAPELALRARWPMTIFVMGLFFASSSYFFNYLAQYAIFREGEGRTDRLHHSSWQWITAGVLALSLLSFGFAAIAAVSAMASLPKP